MRAKHLIFIIIFLLLFTLVNAAESGDFPFKIVWNCEAEGIQQCDLVVGQVYEYDIIPEPGDAPSFFLFPYEGYLTSTQIDCASLESIVISKYDQDLQKWVPLQDSEVINTQGAGVRVKAPLREPGTYAVVKKTKEFFDEGWCVPLACGESGGFISVPFNKKVSSGENILLEFCGMIGGCDATRDGSCNKYCPLGVDPDCTHTECLSEADGCCNVDFDLVCDPDCYLDPTVNSFGPDPDCMYGDEAGADLLKLTEETKPTDSLKQSIVTKQWTQKTFPVNAIVYGDISIKVGEDNDADLWFKDFSYLDYDGNEHFLRPICNTFSGRTELSTIYCGSEGGRKGQLIDRWMPDKKYEDPDPEEACEGLADSAENEQKYRLSYCDLVIEMMPDYFTRFPQQWYQLPDNPEIQFQLPPTPVKEFRVFSSLDDSPASFTLSYTKYGDEEAIDKDGDGFHSGRDCHDTNAEIYPGAEERCNGFDDDCDAFTYDYSETTTLIPEESKIWSTTKNHQFQMKEDGFIVIKESGPHTYLEVEKAETHWTDNQGKYHQYTDEELLNQNPSQILLSHFYEKTGTIRLGIEGDTGLWTTLGGIFSLAGAPGTTFIDYDEIRTEWRMLRSQMKKGDSTDNYGNSCGIDMSMKKPLRVIGMESSIPEFGITNPSADCGQTATFHTTGNSASKLRIYNRQGEEIYTAGKTGIVLTTQNPKLISANQDSLSTEYNGVIIQLKQYDQLRGTTWGDNGHLNFDVYYYKPKINLDNVDEGCTRKPKQVHVCSIQEFNQNTRSCYEGTELCQTELGKITGDASLLGQAQLDSDVAACSVTTGTEYGIQDFWVWICEEGKDCYPFLTDNYEVCQATEVCTRDQVGDFDCDGVMNFDENGDALDSDCTGSCIYQDCDLLRQEWCNEEGAWITEDYCKVCGTLDASCAKVCEEGEKSCGAGCRQGACDTTADLWCNGGVWTKTDYSTQCAMIDASIGGTCQEGSCDADEQKTCWQEAWLDKPVAYCRKCFNYDMTCLEAEKECVIGSCDIKNNAQCTGDEWTLDNYCNECGAIDSDCGIKSCESGTCDYAQGKWCDAGIWKTEGYCNLAICGADSASREKCLCDQEVETSCTDGIDNDCNGLTDCADANCPADNCKCVEGSTKECGQTLGECTQGLYTCNSGLYGECVGEIAPSREVCDSLDNDCDGSIDEQCGGCSADEKRSCGIDLGSCSSGIQECDDEGYWSVCYGQGYGTTSAEVCDGLDNDCDGVIDEDCPCLPGENKTCGSDIGECTVGVMVCQENFEWGTCNGKQKLPEVCTDTKDNDCDGLIDAADDDCVGTVVEAEDKLEKQKKDNLETYDYTFEEEEEEDDYQEEVECVTDSDCPDGTCDASGNCADKPASDFPWFYVIAGVGIIILGAVLYIFFGKKKGTPVTKLTFGGGKPSLSTKPSTTPSFIQRPKQFKVRKSKEEELLEKSLKK